MTAQTTAPATDPIPRRILQGYVHPDFTSVADALTRQVATAPLGTGASLCVYHRGEPVVDAWIGEAGVSGEPWAEDTVAMCFSSSKGVTSTALHVLADRGLVDYDAPVAEYWPEFARNGKGGITVRHVMSHGAGLHGIRRIVDHADRMLDWEHMVEALANATPSYEPGTRSGYHALTYGWLIGEIVRRVDGRPINDFVQAEIAGPLGIDALTYGVPEDRRHRIAKLQAVSSGAGGPKLFKPVGEFVGKALSATKAPVNTRRMINALVPRGMGDLFWRQEMYDAVIPAANGFFDARSLARHYAMISGHGELDGVRILSAETVDKMGKVQSRRPDYVLVFPMRWRLGYHLVGTTKGIVPRAFGHFGFGGSGGWADPVRDVAVGYVPSRGVGTPFGDLRLLQLDTVIVDAVNRRNRAAA
jgi:CubicO group peptidase (beta-lactamase class C family)